MSVYVVGDVQGCYDELRRLLDQIRFDPEQDILWLAGDIVNRGPQSLSTLRYVKSLGNRAIMVLGNHDLHLLALSQGFGKRKGKDHTLDPILQSKDRDELFSWLRQRPLMHHSDKLGFSMIHAGLPPEWDIPTALKRAKEVEKILQGDRIGRFLSHMYGNQPRSWQDDLKGFDRLRFITNCFTRLRYCDAKGNLALGEKGAPGKQRRPVMPWFLHPNRASRHDRILFGHWSTLGYHHSDNVWALDSGCLWGGALTAVKLSKRNSPRPFHLPCPGTRTP